MTVSDGGTSFALDSGSIVANHGVALTVTTGALNIGNSSTAGTPAGNTAGGIRVETKKGTAIEVNGNVTIGRPNITDGMSRRTVNIVAGDSFYVASSLSKMDGTAIKAADVLIQRSATATIEAKDGYAIEAGDVTIQRNGSVSVTVAAGNKTEMHAINAAGDVTIGKNLNVDESVNSDTANIVIRTASPSKNAENLTYAVYAPSGKVIVSAPSNVASLTIEATGAGSKAIYTDADDIFINGKVYAVGAPHPVGTTGGIINIAGRAGALYSEAGDVKLSSFASPSTIGNNVRLGVTAEGGYVIEAVEGAVNMDSVVVSQPAAGVATVGVPVYFVRAKGDVVLEGAVVTVPANDKLQAVIYGESDVIVKAKVFVG